MLGDRDKSQLDQQADQVRKDSLRAKEGFGRIGLHQVKSIGTPSDRLNEDNLELAESQGVEGLHWNIETNDWTNTGTEDIVNTVMEETDNGHIVLFHASDAVKQTEKALPTILPALSEKGFS